MTTDENIADQQQLAVSRSLQALKLVCASLPHLSGLANTVRIQATDRIPVAAIGVSGLTLVNTKVFCSIPLADAMFILAHELMHLALDTHGRAGNADRLAVNFAHDYIINDMLREELNRDPPLDGLDMPGARTKSMEAILLDLRWDRNPPKCCWWVEGLQPSTIPLRSALAIALEGAGLVETPTVPANFPTAQDLQSGDLLPEDSEKEFEPDLTDAQRQSIKRRVRKVAVKAASLSVLNSQIAASEAVALQSPEVEEQMMSAVRHAFSTPWQLVLQRWMDSLSPGERTYSRPSRRGADRQDIVLPGRRREGWTLNIVLDTSGSMEVVLAKALGSIAMFCDANGVDTVRILQCDQEVTADRVVDVEELNRYRILGFGGSDMTPAMDRLAEDPEVTGVLVLTDGCIDFPQTLPPYQVLWGILSEWKTSFSPPYGDVTQIDLSP